MKKRILPILLFFAAANLLHAQVVNLSDVMGGRQSQVTVHVRDSVSREPLSFASVYLIPEKDTVITNFTLTDMEGKATLDEVPFGAYSFHVEMLGYHPSRTRTYLRNENVDMGTILMVVDPHYLEAAVVSDVGNPVIVKKDTLIFNAASFRTNANAMLKDLLLKLPGVEITPDGRVKINGQTVDKVTVGGRTFFFDDQAMALNNLPASIVEKISFIDRDSMEKRATGVESGTKEKVMDVTLKKEYEKGWFGNVALRGGTSVGKEEDDLRDNSKLLYKNNALLAAYTEKDQVTVVGNLVNVTDDDMLVVVDQGDDIYQASRPDGLVTVGQIGMNVNTARIKDVETTAMLNYRHSGMLSGNRLSRTTFLSGGDLLTSSENRGQESSDQYSGKAEFRKESGKVWFMVSPDLLYRSGLRTSTEESSTSRGGALLNHLATRASEQFTNKNAKLKADVILQDLFGKTGRSLWIATSGGYYQEASDRDETTSSLISSATQMPVFYGREAAGRQFSGKADYSEPLGEKWLLNATALFQMNRWNDTQNAVRDEIRQNALSCQSDLTFLQQRYEGSLQYSFSEDHTLRLGVRAVGLKEILDASLLTARTGDKWHWHLAPVIAYNRYKNHNRWSVEAMNYLSRPDRRWFAPVPDISVPSQVQIGNAYLKSGYTSYMNTRFEHSNPEKYTSLFLSIHGYLTSLPAVMAQWNDESGIRYSVPVNAARPSVEIMPMANYTFHLGKKKAWSMTFGSNNLYSRSSSYYSFDEGKSIDINTFQYTPFMEDFWGNADGNRFFSGKSGFSENITHWVNADGWTRLRYNGERFSASVIYDASVQRAWYSLLPDVKRNTFDQTFSLGGSYTTKHEFELSSDLSYTKYYGYAAGFGLPEWIWNFEISKNVGPFNLSIQANDLLDQTRSLTRSAQSNYEETSCRLVMGRYVLFGVRWNFGKMNASHSMRAETAALEMSL